MDVFIGNTRKCKLSHMALGKVFNIFNWCLRGAISIHFLWKCIWSRKVNCTVPKKVGFLMDVILIFAGSTD